MVNPLKWNKNPEAPCVYAMVNTVNGLLYVGQTSNLKRRVHHHRYDYRSGRQANAKLKQGLDEFGWSSFNFIVLEIVPDAETRLRLEGFWMTVLRSRDQRFGYNLRMDDGQGMRVHHTTRLKLSNTLKLKWANGEKSDHGLKLKKSWNDNPDRRIIQSKVMTVNKTKYSYIVHETSAMESDTRRCTYKDLKALNLHSILSTFSRGECDIGVIKNRLIRRIKLNEVE